MVDRQFAEPRLAALYDPVCGQDERDDFGFYGPLVMAADSVLDVGCGTGVLLEWARRQGHPGRLVGLDPAEAMLDVAGNRSVEATDVEWITGDLTSVHLDAGFDLVVMTGHAFQVLVTDEELRSSLRAIHGALTPGGRFAFETRNPATRGWENWGSDYAIDFTDANGVPGRFTAEVQLPVVDGIVHFVSAHMCDDWDEPEESYSTLRFLAAPDLAVLLGGARFTVDEQFGDWDGSPLSAQSPEIITIARRA